MIFEISKEDEVIMKSFIKPNLFVITKEGLRKIKSVHSEYVQTIDENDSEQSYNFSDVIPLLKGFKHLKVQHLYDVVDIITDNKGYGNYKTNFHFLPHFIEVTEESIELKVQFFNNFDIIHCDNLIKNLGQVYHYLASHNYDVYGLHKKGLAVIDSDSYETRKFR